VGIVIVEQPSHTNKKVSQKANSPTKLTETPFSLPFEPKPLLTKSNTGVEPEEGQIVIVSGQTSYFRKQLNLVEYETDY